MTTDTITTDTITGFDARLSAITSALAGDHGDDAARIAEIGIEWLEMLLRKNRDYGGSVWREPVLAPGMPAAEAIFVRMSDKVERIRSLRGRDDGPAVDESLEDTIRDLGAYCLLLLARPGATK